MRSPFRPSIAIAEVPRWDRLGGYSSSAHHVYEEILYPLLTIFGRSGSLAPPVLSQLCGSAISWHNRFFY